jgi:hypothetical protein
MQSACANHEHPNRFRDQFELESEMNTIIYVVGLVVIVGFILNYVVH